jgi:hypothetical protein
VSAKYVLTYRLKLEVVDERAVLAAMPEGIPYDVASALSTLLGRALDEAASLPGVRPLN